MQRLLHAKLACVSRRERVDRILTQLKGIEMGDNSAAIELFRKALDAGSVEAFSEAIDAAASEDFVEEWPQSGERIRGKATVKRINEGYSSATGTTPKMRLRRIVGDGDVRVVEGTIDYGDGTPVNYVGIAEFKDGKLAKITEYFASPFEAPAWRADFVERMEPAGVR
jgi:SnoaL-like domain